ncbi:MAG: hypothetical protein HKO57_00365, partial [Akkermansiaceae bacterium]|nr:hypothetical protein [Akkermansiaceae bacterium]
PIGDPENAELNQAWIRYAQDGAGLKAGRQRIIRNNAAFIGNVGWRQNEQTYDAIEGSFSNDNLSLSYVYSDRVQRIFGDDANDALPGPPLRDFEGEFHFIDGSYRAPFGETGAYAYLIDVDNNAAVGESNTVGAFIKAGPVHAEAAWQDGTSSLAGPAAMNDYDAFYGHLVCTHEAGPATLTGGLEYLEENFKTPFATVHAFNGFADAFILQRTGLNKAGGGAYTGLADFYLGYSQGGLPGGLVFKGFLHYFLDDGFSDAYGWEADAVLVKKINENVTALFKAARFSADDPGYADIEQVSVQLDIKF